MKRHISALLLLFIALGFLGCSAITAPDTSFTPDASITVPTDINGKDTTLESSTTAPQITEEPTSTETVHVHDFSAATCFAPKTCSVCGATTGDVADHTYIDRICAVCGYEKSGSNSSNDMVWIPTKGGKKYHAKETCSNMIDPEKVTKSEAENLGFDPCKRCYK